MWSDAFEKAVALRFPIFDREDPPTPRERLEAIEDHVMACGFYHGELVEERLRLREKMRPRQHEWDHLQGWEGQRVGKTDQAVTEAKRTLRPDLYDGLKSDANRMKDLTEQIDRLDREHDKASRLYTIMTA